jgi:Glycosyl hydrolases family 28
MEKIKVQKSCNRLFNNIETIYTHQNHKYLLLSSVILAMIFASTSHSSAQLPKSGKVVVYPAPADEVISTDYSVEVNGQPVDIYLANTRSHDKKYYFAYFDFSGEVNIHVTSHQSFENVEILPASCGIKPTLLTKDNLTFTVRHPFRISIERDGENSPLLLFGNPLDEDAVKTGDPNVVYFGPGIHKPGKILLKSNQTLYLAGGAVVKGGIEAHGNNIKILGRGILDGKDYPHSNGPTIYMLHLEKCKNVIIKDIIIRGSWYFTIAPCGSDHVMITDVKICGSQTPNDDGIDLINSSNVLISDCFLRTDDDCIAIKGQKGYDRKNCEKITVKDCSFWTDYANIFRIGYESEACAMRNITAKNIDVLHFLDNRPPETFWANCVMYIQPSDNMPMDHLRFENLRINASNGNNLLVKMIPMICRDDENLVKSGNLEPGRYVKDCRFKNIVLSGKTGGGPGLIYVAGADAKHPVKNVIFENVVRFGNPTFADSPDVRIGPFTNNIRFINH